MGYPTIAELVDRGREAAKSHKPIMSLAEQRANRMKMSATLIVTCVDPRCNPEHIFDLKPAEIIVHRNGGGSVRNAISDICALDVLVGLEEIMVIHHTDCGALLFKNEGMRERIIARVGSEHADEVHKMDFGGLLEQNSIEQSTRDDIAWLKQSPLVRKELSDKAQGYVYDVATGDLRWVA